MRTEEMRSNDMRSNGWCERSLTSLVSSYFHHDVNHTFITDETPYIKPTENLSDHQPNDGHS